MLDGAGKFLERLILNKVNDHLDKADGKTSNNNNKTKVNFGDSIEDI